jgi:hypothetical protein
MKRATELKTLGDMRTIVSTHTRSAPRHRGSTYLDVLSLGMEKLRLETELAWHARRQGRLELRLRELQETMGKRLLEVQRELPSAAPPPVSPNGPDHPPREPEENGGRWRSMTIGY